MNSKTCKVPSINDIVLIKDEKMPKYKWRLGRVVELNFGRDNKIRSVKLLVGSSRTFIRRPVNHLFPIEYLIK